MVKENSWPKCVKKLNSVEKNFYDRKSELTILQGCLLVEERVVIPENLKASVLKELHRGHSGIVRTKQLARGIVYWKGLDNDIENIVKNCENCQLAAKQPQKVPLNPWPTPERVWQRVHIDYAGPMDGFYLLVVVDSLSKWPEVVMTRSISASTTVKILDTIFARNEFPETLVSDNGTQFSSKEFREMCENYGIEHLKTAPYHPQSNGRAERFVDTEM